MAAQHVDPEEAVHIMCDLDARMALGHGWGKLTDEMCDDPAIRYSAALAARGIAPSMFEAMQPGDVSRIQMWPQQG